MNPVSKGSNMDFSDLINSLSSNVAGVFGNIAGAIGTLLNDLTSIF